MLDGVAAGYGPPAARSTGPHRRRRSWGVQLREGFAVKEYLSDPDRIVGIRGRIAAAARR